MESGPGTETASDLRGRSCGDGLVYPAIFAVQPAWGTLVASTIPLVAIFPIVLNAVDIRQEPGSLSSSYPRHMLVLAGQDPHAGFLADVLWLTRWRCAFGLVTVKVVYRSSGLAIPHRDAGSRSRRDRVVVSGTGVDTAGSPRWLRGDRDSVVTLTLGFPVPFWIIL